jgi:hypothetical protein
MSDEKFEPCTPPDGLFDTNAISAALTSETFRMGEIQVAYEGPAFVQLSPWDRIFLQEMADDLDARLRQAMLKGKL